MADFKTYHLLAQNILDGRTNNADYISMFPHVLGYPFVLSLFFRIFGAHVVIAQLVGALFSALCGVLIYLIGKTIMNETYAMTAALLWLLLPSKVLYGTLVCTENFFNALSLGIILVFLITMKKQDTHRKPVFFILMFVLIGASVAALSAIRPNALILLVAVILFTFVKAPVISLFTLGKRNISKLLLCLCSVIAYMTVSAFITARIEQFIQQPVSKTKIGWNLFVGMNGASRGHWNAEDADLFGSILAERGAEETQRFFLEQGIDRLHEHIQSGDMLRFLRLKTISMWYGDHEAIDYASPAQDLSIKTAFPLQRYQKHIILVCDVYYYLLLILTLLCLTMSLKRAHYSDIVILSCLMIIGTVLLHIPFEAAPRYHNNALVWLCFPAAQSLMWLAGRPANRLLK
jgi:4-amino-4-deoxy-L-arabinose transferase-like glycosyltransferase